MPRLTRTILATVLVLYIVLHFLALSIQKRKPELNTAERFLVRITLPVQWIMKTTVSGTVSAWKGYFYLVGLSQENERLVKEKDDLRGQLVKLKEEADENRRLRKLVELDEHSPFSLIVAPRVATGPSPYERIIRVRRGSLEGVSKGAAAIHPLGVVGQVVEVREGDADVLLITDVSSALSVIDQRSRTHAILRGDGPNLLRMEYVSKHEDVEKGDELVTSGLDGVFPSGLPVGVVQGVEKKARGMFLAAEVSPHVFFSRLEEVGIVRGKE